MRITTLVSLLLTFFVSLTVALEHERTVEVLTWPLSAPKAQPFAKVSYNSTSGVIKSYTAPRPTSPDEIIRLGFHRGSEWSGIVTAAGSFAASKEKTLQLLLNEEGEVYHVGFRAVDTVVFSKQGGDVKDAGLSVEVVRMKDGPRPHLNTPVVVRQDGSQEGVEPEKSFFQKYWWAIAAVLLLQVLIAPGKQE